MILSVYYFEDILRYLVRNIFMVSKKCNLNQWICPFQILNESSNMGIMAVKRNKQDAISFVFHISNYNTFIIFKYSGHSPMSFQACSLTGKQPTRPPRVLIFSISWVI